MNRGITWQLPLLAREAVLNVRHSRRRLRPLLVLAVLLGALLPVLGAVDSTTYRRDLAALEQSGAYVVIMTAESGTQVINRHSCDRLDRLDGVTRSGAVLTSTRQSVTGVGSNVAVTPVTGSLVSGLGNSPVVIGHALTTQATQHLVLTGKTVQATRGTPQPEGIPLDRSLSIVAGPEVEWVDRCAAVLEPGAQTSVVAPLLHAALDLRSPHVTASPVLNQTIDRTAAYLERPTRWVPAATGLLLGVLLAISMMTRQSELAAYRLSGSSRAAVQAILLLEATLISGALGASAAAASIALRTHVLDVPALMFGGLGAASLALVISVVASAVVSRQSLLTMTKER